MGKTIRFRRATVEDKPFLLELRQLTMNEYLRSAGIETSAQYHLSRIEEYFDDSNIIEYENVIIKGKIHGGALRKSENVTKIKYRSDRKIMNTKEVSLYTVKLVVFKVLRQVVPHKLFFLVRKIKLKIIGR